MTTVLIAPDSFKGTASARAVARAVAHGWGSARPDDHCIELPLADGGEGTLEAIETAIPAALRITVPRATTYDRPGSAYWLLLPDGTGVAELAVTNGIGQLPALDPMGADTTGFGQVIAAALDFGVPRLLLAIGGSASSDGGSGALTALGARFLDAADDPVRPGAAGLRDVHRVDLVGLRACPVGAVTILTDVTNPLLGPRGAARTYAPQKGADPAQVELIESALARLAIALPQADPETPGAGAAGGAGFGLMAWGASAASGADVVARLCGLDPALHTADLVIVGEGAYDGQSAQGKLVGMVADRARRLGKRVLLVAGAIHADPVIFDGSIELTALAGSQAQARTRALHWIADAASTLAAEESARTHARQGVAIRGGLVPGHTIEPEVPPMPIPTRYADLPAHHPGRRVLSGRTPTFASQVDPRCSFTLFVPEDVQDDESPLSLWVFVHGTGRQLELYLDAYAELARRHRAVVMTPLFPAGIPGPDDVYNYQAIERGGTRFDEVLLRMVDEVADRWNVERSTFFLHGFSGGGQFCLRFAVLHPERLAALSVGAPGQVTLLTTDQPWPYGTGGLAEALGADFDAAGFAALPTQVVVGSLDDDPEDIALPGPHGAPAGRLTQAKALAESMRDIGTTTRFDLVEGAGHDGAAMLPAVTEFLREHLAR